MLHHVSVGVRDVERAMKFYDPVLKALGYKRVVNYLPGAVAYGESRDRPEFWVGLPHDQKLPNGGNGTHIAFAAKGKAAVNKFHDAALKAGASNNGEPGPRPDYGPGYYGAFVYDLDGNKVEAVFIAVARPAKSAATKARSKKPAKKAKKKAKRR